MPGTELEQTEEVKTSRNGEEFKNKLKKTIEEPQERWLGKGNGQRRKMITMREKLKKNQNDECNLH